MPVNYANYLSGIPSPVDRLQKGVLFGQQQSDRRDKQAADEAFQAEFGEFVNKENKTLDDYITFTTRNPSLAKAYAGQMKLLSEGQQKTLVSQAINVYAALTNGQTGKAVELLETQKQAAINSGNVDEANKADIMLRTIQIDPTKALSTMGIFLSSTMGPSKFGDMMKSLGQGGGGGSFTTPQAGVDPEGKPIFFTTDKSGIKKVIPGVRPRDNITQVDSETETFLYNKEGVLLKTISKQTGAGAKIKAANQLQAKREIDLINMETDIQLTIDVIDKIIGNEELGIPEHPGLVSAVGLYDSQTPTFFPQTKDFEILAEQLRGKAFLTAYQSLKGGGPITDIEGRQATAAQARLNSAQSEEAYRESIKEMRDLLVARRAKARKLAGVGGVKDGGEIIQNGWVYKKDENGKMVAVRKADG